MLKASGVVREVIDSIGGINQLSKELDIAVAYASSLRDYIPAWREAFTGGGGGLISKVCFDDGMICWPDKNPTAIQGAYYGEAIIREYCPNIPIPEIKAWVRNELHHLFTEWVEGKSLHERVTEVGTNHLNGTSLLKISRTVATSLADFVYNLTTFPIPVNMSRVINNLD
jgi:hypothetical protein